MTFALTPDVVVAAVIGLLLGLAVGSLTWGRAARRHRRVADSVANAAAAASARTQVAASQRELAAAQAAMRPLADEVDRLKRDLARARTPVQTALPLAADAPAATEVGPGVAGTGPIVVAAPDGAADAVLPDDFPDTALPDIRRLKGVGDKFAVALTALGLGSVDRLARLSPDEAADADARLGTFAGRIARDRLVEQAVLIDEGRMTEYAARFGQLG